MKKIIVSVLTLILTLCVGLAISCKDEETYTLTLNKTSVTVDKYMNTFVIPEYNGNEVLNWSSANTAVATVDNGRIYGVKEGSTQVTVTDGKVSASCSVTVKSPDPDKFSISLAEKEFSMFLGSTKTLIPVLTYSNVPVSGATFSYSTDGQNVSVSAEGVITANSVGNAIVAIKSTIEGRELIATVNVEVQDVYALEIQQTNVVLYPFESYGDVSYNNTINCTAEVYKEGAVLSVDASDINWSVPAQDVISVDADGKVTALNGGKAILTASYTVDGKTICGETEITVDPVSVKVEGKVLDAGRNTPFSPNLNELIGVVAEVSKIVVDATGEDSVEVYPQNYSFDFSGFNSGEADIKIVTRNLAYEFEAMIYDGIIADVEDMKALLTATSGIYKFAADINMAEYESDMVSGKDSNVWVSETAFIGTIDGGNHLIKNFKTSTGLFNKFNGGTIKNIRFENVLPQGNIGLFGNLQRDVSQSILIDNVFVSFGNGTSDWYAGLMGDMNLRENFTISNSVIIASEKLAGKVAIAGRVGSYAINIKNCYLVDTKVYIQSLNENLSKEEQQALHDPATNNYYACKTLHDLKLECDENGIKVTGVTKAALQVQLSKLMLHSFVLKKDANAHWYFCVCGLKFGVQAHVGEPTCQQSDICSVCSQEFYGAHVYSQVVPGVENHTYKCVCGAESKPENHYGGTATCTEQAKCEACGTAYGELHNFVVLQFDNDKHWYKCEGCELRINEGVHYGGNLTDENGEKAICAGCKQPYGEPLPQYIEITNQNVSVLLNATEGIYRITEDIDMATAYTDNGGVWASTMSFNGTIDGGNHTIKNFKTTTGLFKEFNGGTIKDLAFTNVTTLARVGLFGGYNRNVSKDIIVDNVYAEFGASTTDWHTGLFGEMNLREKLNVSNSVIISSASLSGKVAVVGRVGSYAINLDNCYLVNTKVFVASLNNGTTEQLNKLHDPATNVYAAYKTLHDIFRAYNDGEVDVSGIVKTVLEAKLLEFDSHEYNVQKNENEHWYLCSCGEEFGRASHVGEATCSVAAACTVCGQQYYGGHVYDQLKSDANNHWYECVCGEKTGIEVHVGGTPTCTKKAKCDVCGTRYGELHNMVEVWFNEEQHWLKCDFCDLTIGHDEHFGGNLTSENGEKAICSGCGEPYGDPLLPYLALTNENIDILLQSTGGVYRLEEDIDMETAYTANGGVWASTISFKGVIDGNNHVIKNLKTSTGLFKEFNGGTIKDLAFTNVMMQGRKGLFGSYNRSGAEDIVVDNVYVEFGTSSSDWYIGLFGDVNLSAKLTISNTVVYTTTKLLSGKAGVVGRVGSGAITLNNCYLIHTDVYVASLNTALSADAQKALHDPATNVYGKYDDVAEFLLDYMKGDVTGLGEFINDILDELIENNDSVAFISSKNVAKLLDVKANATIVITEDIDMATAYTANNGVWTSTVDFCGTIIGNNHVIENFKTNTGLFKNYYGGTLKDLAFVNVSTIGNVPVLGGYENRNNGKIYNIDNLFVHVDSTTGTQVALLGSANLVSPLNMTNSMVVSDVVPCGIFLKAASQPIKLTNVYLINTVPYLASHYDGSKTAEEIATIMLPTTNTAYSYATIQAMKDSGYTSGQLSALIENLAGLNNA